MAKDMAEIAQIGPINGPIDTTTPTASSSPFLT